MPQFLIISVSCDTRQLMQRREHDITQSCMSVSAQGFPAVRAHLRGRRTGARPAGGAATGAAAAGAAAAAARAETPARHEGVSQVRRRLLWPGVCAFELRLIDVINHIMYAPRPTSNSACLLPMLPAHLHSVHGARIQRPVKQQQPLARRCSASSAAASLPATWVGSLRAH